jgi:hypothetical protein
MIPVLVALGGLVANLTLTRYRRELAVAGVAEREAAGYRSRSAA